MVPADDAIIQVENFRAEYGGQVVLRDVNFQVRPGEVLVIAGGSGCGKSTLMKHMIGLYEPAAGRIVVQGDDLWGVDEEARRTILHKFGVAFQGGALFGSMTVLENVKLPLDEFTHMEESLKQMVALTKLQLVGLADAASKMPAELSGGMQKRAALARAIALDPAIVYLDEPSAGLDPVTSAGLDELIKTLRGLLGTTFVMVSHELASIFAVADRVIMLDAGEKTLIATGSPADLKNSPDPRVKAFFNRETA